MNNMSKLINKIYTIKSHLEMHESDPLLIESYNDYYHQLKQQHGHYLNELLFGIYDEHCSDDEVREISDYLSPVGVAVEAYDLPGIHARLHLKPEPLRITLTDVKFNQVEILWKAC